MATFEDGTVICQDFADVSSIDPKRSMFFDVLQREDKLVRFELRGEGHTYAVDLVDGHFEVDGVSFFMQEQPMHDLKLIYFRDHTHTFNMSSDGRPSQELDHLVIYRFGWQATGADEKKYKEVIQIA